MQSFCQRSLETAHAMRSACLLYTSIFNCSHYGEIYAWGDIKKGSGISPVKNSSGKYFEVTEKNTILSDEEKFVVSIE